METVTSKGITYNVIERNTPEQMEAKGLVNFAAQLRKNNEDYLVLQRPNRRRYYMAFQSHKYSDAIQVLASVR